MWLAAHYSAVDITDRAAVDSGAGVVKESGTGELRTIFESQQESVKDSDYHRTKYGRRFVDLRRTFQTVNGFARAF